LANTSPIERAVEAAMSDSRSPTDFEQTNAPPIKRGLIAVPSWMLSLVLHGGLIVLLAAVLASRSGGIVGDPNGDFRRIGIYVGHSGGGGDGTGEGPSEKEIGSTRATAPQQPAAAPPTHLVADSVPTPATPAEAPKAVAVQTSKSQPVIGPGATIDTPPDHARKPLAESTGTSSEEPRESKPPTSGKLDGLAYATRGGGSGHGGGPRGSYGTAPFFGIWDAGAKFVYVIDCSGSMFSYNSMQAAKNELLSSLASLRRSQQFQIVFYNLDQRWMKAPGKTDFQYFPASESNRRLAAQFVAEVQPGGGTLHLPALTLALQLHPDVIFFLTDAGEPAMKPEEMEEIQRLNGGRSRIHCVQFGMHDNEAADFLRKLAAQNNGDFAYQNVKRFAESGSISRGERSSIKPVGEPNSSSLPGR
jgi:hypothetical protein